MILSPDAVIYWGTLFITLGVACIAIYVVRMIQRASQASVESLVYPLYDYLDILEQTGKPYREIEFQAWLAETYGPDFAISYREQLLTSIQIPA